MIRFKSFISEDTNDGWTEKKNVHGHYLEHNAKIHGHHVKFSASTIPNLDDDYGPSDPHHYEVSFEVNHTLNSRSNKVQPHHALAILKHVRDKVKETVQKTGAKKISWDASDVDEHMMKKKHELYKHFAKSLGKKVSVRKHKNLDGSTDPIGGMSTVKINESPLSSALWHSVKANAKYLPVAIPAPGGMPVWYAKVAKDAYSKYKELKKQKAPIKTNPVEAK